MKKFIKLIILLPLIFVWAESVNSQVVTWQKFYRTKGNPSVTVITDIVQTDDEGYIFIGRSARDSLPGSVLFAYGINKFGDSLWYKEYFNTDAGGRIRKLNDGNFMIIDGFCTLIKIKSNGGDTVWRKERPDTAQTLYRMNFEFKNNEFFICGYNSNHKPYFLRLDSLGNDISYKEFDYNFGYAQNVLIDGNYVYTVGYQVLPENYFIAKTDPVGNMIWIRDYNQKIINFKGRSPVIKSPYEESIILGGSSNINNSNDEVPSLMKRDTAGNILWQYNYDNGNYDLFQIFLLSKDLTNNIISLALSTHPVGNSAWLIKFDFNGNELWRKNYSLKQEHFEPLCFNITSDSGYIIGGLALGGAHVNSPVYLIKTDNIGNVVSVNNNSEILPSDIMLYQNYPNPFNPSTTISYYLPVTGDVNLTVYDILGRKIITLVNEKKYAGKHNVKLDASTFKSGGYFYRLEAGKVTETKRMMLIK